MTALRAPIIRLQLKISNVERSSPQRGSAAIWCGPIRHARENKISKMANDDIHSEKSLKL
jgi:hypothetical protein